METDKHYVKVGSFVLLILMLCAAFSIWLGGAIDNRKYTDYRIRFAESVSGLSVGSAVKYRGVQVGKVKSMEIDPSNIQLILVDINVLKTTPVKSDTVANLKLQGITGGFYVDLSGNDVNAPDLVSSDKDTPPEIPAQPSALAQIMDQVPEILQKISHITDQVDKLFTDKNIKAISHTVGNMQKASENANELTNSLKENPTRLIFGPKNKEKTSQ